MELLEDVEVEAVCSEFVLLLVVERVSACGDASKRNIKGKGFEGKQGRGKLNMRKELFKTTIISKGEEIDDHGKSSVSSPRMER